MCVRGHQSFVHKLSAMCGGFLKGCKRSDLHSQQGHATALFPKAGQYLKDEAQEGLDCIRQPLQNGVQQVEHLQQGLPLDKQDLKCEN